MIKKSRFVLAIGLVLALGVGSLAFADGASNNTAFVDGGVTPKKLDKKKFKPGRPAPRDSHRGHRRRQRPAGQPERVEYISYDKNIKFNFNAGEVSARRCASREHPGPGGAACPPSSYLGSGEAEVQGPGIPPITDIVVSVFRGPAKNGIQLHTFSPTLGQAAPTVLGSVVKSNAGSSFGYALSVPNAPETGGLMITKFNATISKASKAVTARCKNKKFLFQRKVTYNDGSSETTADLSVPCKQKKKKK